MEMAKRRPFRAVVVESAFTSVKEMASVSNRVIARFLPPFMVVKAKYDNLAKIPGARSPVLIVHGDADTTVPHRMGLALYEAAPEPKADARRQGRGARRRARGGRGGVLRDAAAVCAGAGAVTWVALRCLFLSLDRREESGEL